MKLDKPKITISNNYDHESDTNLVTIYVSDTPSRMRFLKLVLTPQQLVSALGGLAEIEIQGELDNLDKVGKKMQIDYFEFEIPDGLNKKAVARANVGHALIDQNKQEWTPDMNLSSQDSFFERDGKWYARTIIRKWD